MRHLLIRYRIYYLTDNLSLTFIQTTKDSTGFFARLGEYLTQFDIQFIFRAGKDSPVEDSISRQLHHPAWNDQERMGLADYEDDADDSAPPAVPANVPNLADVMTEKSRGLAKPYEVQGASHLDEIPEERKLVDAFRLMVINEENKENIPPKETEDLTVISVRHGKKLVPRSREAEAVDETTMEPEAGEDEELMAALETLQKLYT